jgi:5-formyltetrahydrofolate cyclo-ligase
LRRRHLARRAALDAPTLARAAAGIAAEAPTAPTVAAYVSVGAEPGTGPLLARLRRLGTRVLLPVVSGGTLDWAAYDGPETLAAGRFGLREPTGARLGPSGLAGADLVLLPALAVDARGGRLGRGGGFYDRALVGLPRGRLVAVVHAFEVVAEVPVEPHDVRVGAVLTPVGLTWFPEPEERGNT